MGFDSQACLGARIAAGFVGFEPTKADVYDEFRRAENFYNIPTIGRLEIGTTARAVTVLTPQILHNPEHSAGTEQERAFLATTAKVRSLAWKAF